MDATITTAAELEELPVGAVVVDRDGDAWTRAYDGAWFTPETEPAGSIRLARKWAPLRVVHRGDVPPPPAPSDDALTTVRRAISDPGHVLPRRRDLGPDGDQLERLANWSARAVLAVLGRHEEVAS
jgi:hypothetical protein